MIQIYVAFDRVVANLALVPPHHRLRDVLSLKNISLQTGMKVQINQTAITGPDGLDHEIPMYAVVSIDTTLAEGPDRYVAAAAEPPRPAPIIADPLHGLSTQMMQVLSDRARGLGMCLVVSSTEIPGNEGVLLQLVDTPDLMPTIDTVEFGYVRGRCRPIDGHALAWIDQVEAQYARLPQERQRRAERLRQTMTEPLQQLVQITLETRTRQVDLLERDLASTINTETHTRLNLIEARAEVARLQAEVDRHNTHLRDHLSRIRANPKIASLSAFSHGFRVRSHPLVVVHPVTEVRYAIGAYDLEVNWASFELKWTPVVQQDGVHHPMLPNGRPIIGPIADSVIDKMVSKDMAGLVSLGVRFLERVPADMPTLHLLDTWPVAA